MLLQDVLFEQDLVVKGISDEKSANQFISRIEKIDDRGEAQVLVRQKLDQLIKRLKDLGSKSAGGSDLEAAVEVLKAWTKKNPLGDVPNPAQYSPNAPYGAQSGGWNGNPGS
jgi:hypothetical protein